MIACLPSSKIEFLGTNMRPISHSKISQIVDLEVILQAYYCEIMVVCQKPSVFFHKAVNNFSPQILCDF